MPALFFLIARGQSAGLPSAADFDPTCPRFRAWEPDIDEHLFGRVRTPDEISGIYKDIVLARAADPVIHEVGLTLAMILGSFALGRGILEHGFMMPSAIGGLGLGVMAGALSLPHGGNEPIYTVVGVLILALGHRLNAMASD